jgi:hypothetical protein
MGQLRSDQWRDEKLAWRIYVRCRWAYNLGIIAFIGGLLALLVPSPGEWGDPHPRPIFRIVAFSAVVIAILIEAVLTLRWPTGLSNWLVPGFADSKLVKLKNVKELEMDVIDDEEAQRLAFGDYGSPAGDVAAAVAAVKSALGSLATHLGELDQAVQRSARATTSQAQTTEDQLERESLAAAAMRRANIEVTHPDERETSGNSSQPSTLAEDRWAVLNHGPAVARSVHLEIPPSTGERGKQELPPLGQKPELRLLDQKGSLPVVELEDLQVGKEKAVRVSKAGTETYPVSFVLRWTDDDGPHEEQRSIPYTPSSPLQASS